MCDLEQSSSKVISFSSVCSWRGCNKLSYLSENDIVSPLSQHGASSILLLPFPKLPIIFSGTKQATKMTISSLTSHPVAPKLTYARIPTTPTPKAILHLCPARFHSKLNLTSNVNFTSLFLKTKPALKPKSRSSTIRCLFTGIVEEIGEINHLGTTADGGFDLKIRAKTVLQGVHLGDSIAVNGTCLTVTNFTEEEFTVGLAPETLRKTSLVELKIGSLVNLERAVQPTSRMGGHFVQGHVDGTGVIVEKKPEGDSLWVKVKVDKEILRYIVPKGFIAVDGTSLTVVDVFEEEGCFNFMLVAYTQQKIVIPLKNVEEKVNLEVDILGKYVERLLSSGFVD